MNMVRSMLSFTFAALAGVCFVGGMAVLAGGKA